MPRRRGLSCNFFLFWATLALYAVLQGPVQGVRITQLKVPRLVKNGTDVSLDCEFQLEQHETRHLELVVKWFFQGRPEPVFQWIPAHGPPQDLGPLKGRLDLTYGRNRSGAAGLRIVGATTDLTGDYKCALSTFDSEDFMVKRMTVFAPETNMFLQYGRPAENFFNVTCVAEGVYPEPRMALFYARPDVKDKAAIKSAALCGSRVREYPMEGVTVETGRRGDSFTIRASSSEIEDLQHSKAAILFICELKMPDADYCQRRAILYLPGEGQQNHESDDAESESGGHRNEKLALPVAVICTLILYLFCCK